MSLEQVRRPSVATSGEKIGEAYTAVSLGFVSSQPPSCVRKIPQDVDDYGAIRRKCFGEEI